MESKNNDNIIKIKYRIDRIYENELTNLHNKIINNVIVSFDDIGWLFNDLKYFKFDFKKLSVSINGIKKEYETNFGKIQVFNYFSFNEKPKEFNIKDEIFFKFIFNKNINYNEFIKKIYSFRNLLLILGRRHLDFDTIKINEVELIDCYEEYNYKPLNERYLEYLDHHTITLNAINDFGIVVNNFCEIYDSIISVIDSYFCLVKFNIPSKAKFIIACTMIEDYSNLFLVDEAKKYKEGEAKNNKAKFINNIVKEIEEKEIIKKEQLEDIRDILSGIVKEDSQLTFREKVIATIENVNDSFNFDESDIELIANNFRKARKAFIHNGVFPNEVLCQYLDNYSSFTEDLIYLNILKKIGVNINNSIFECFEYNYKKEDLFVMFKQ